MSETLAGASKETFSKQSALIQIDAWIPPGTDCVESRRSARRSPDTSSI